MGFGARVPLNLKKRNPNISLFFSFFSFLNFISLFGLRSLIFIVQQIWYFFHPAVHWYRCTDVDELSNIRDVCGWCDEELSAANKWQKKKKKVKNELRWRVCNKLLMWSRVRKQNSIACQLFWVVNKKNSSRTLIWERFYVFFFKVGSSAMFVSARGLKVGSAISTQPFRHSNAPTSICLRGRGPALALNVLCWTSCLTSPACVTASKIKSRLCHEEEEWGVFRFCSSDNQLFVNHVYSLQEGRVGLWHQRLLLTDLNDVRELERCELTG